MKTKLATYKGGISGRLLAEKLGIELGRDPKSNIINWGSISDINTSVRVLNKPDSVRTATNKHVSRLIMEQSGVPVIQFNGFPAVSRPPKTSMGKMFVVVNSKQEAGLVHRGWSLTTIFPKEKEFRVHVFRGKVLLVSDKNIKSGQLIGNWHVNRNTWRVLKWEEFDPEMCRLSVLAVKCLGLDFGAVDIMVDKDGNYAVCEVNTAPCLAEGELSLSKYMMVFSAWIDGCDKEFNEGFKKGKSWAWKKKDLV